MAKESERLDCSCVQKGEGAALRASNEFLLDCDDCHASSQGRCVDVASAEELPALNREIEEQLEQMMHHEDKHKQKLLEMDERAKLHTLLVHYLSQQLQGNTSLGKALTLRLCCVTLSVR